MVGGTTLVVATVRENLLRKLASKQRLTPPAERAVVKGMPSDDECDGVSDHMVSEHVVLDVRSDPRNCAANALFDDWSE